MHGKRITSILLAGVLAALTLVVAVGPAAGSSGDGGRDDRGPSFDGTVVSIAKNDKALTIARANGQRTRFIVRASTVFEHIAGIDQLSKGTPVEVHAVRNGDRWIATRIEANPGGDDRGGDDRGGSDDPPGDDHGSGGHGSDD